MSRPTAPGSTEHLDAVSILINAKEEHFCVNILNRVSSLLLLPFTVTVVPDICDLMQICVYADDKKCAEVSQGGSRGLVTCCQKSILHFLAEESQVLLHPAR